MPEVSARTSGTYSELALDHMGFQLAPHVYAETKADRLVSLYNSHRFGIDADTPDAGSNPCPADDADCDGGTHQRAVPAQNVDRFPSPG